MYGNHRLNGSEYPEHQFSSVLVCVKVFLESLSDMEYCGILAPAKLIGIRHGVSPICILGVIQTVLVARSGLIHSNLIMVRQRAPIREPRGISKYCWNVRKPLCKMVCESRLCVVRLGIAARNNLVVPSFSSGYFALSPQARVYAEFWIGEVECGW